MKTTLPNWRRLLVLAFVLSFVLALIFSSSKPATSADSTIVIEAESALVKQLGTWTRVEDPAASGGAYLISSGHGPDALELSFGGSFIEVRYVAYVTTGTLAIEVDAQVVRTVRATDDPAVAGTISYLDDHDHHLRVYSVDGVIAVDAVVVSRLAASDTPNPIPASRLFDPIQVGEFEATHIRFSYSPDRALDRQVLRYPGASYIKVHFKSLDLLPGDTVTVSNPAGTESYIYPGSDFTIHESDTGGFWAMSVIGDAAVINVQRRGQPAGSGAGYEIDQFVRGLPEALIEAGAPRSTCGTNQRTDVVCFAGTHPTEFSKSDAVARLLINGAWLCTGWRATAGNFLITNEHCITSQSQTTATEARFNYQRNVCGSGSPNAGTAVSGNRFVLDHVVYDIALISLNSFPNIETFGFLEIDPRIAITGEQIYIPQHGGGNPKEFGITSDMPQDTGGFCRVQDPAFDGNAADSDVGYFCDTIGGSSGSPVLATSTHEVIALHHFGTGANPDQCSASVMNSGARADLWYPLVEKQFLYAPTTVVYTSTPTFIVPKVAGADWYRIYVANALQNILYDTWFPVSQMICNTDTCSVRPPTAISMTGGGTFNWKAQTWSAVGGYTPESALWKFSLSVPTQQTTGVINNDLGTPVIQWSHLNRGETWYQLYVSGPGGAVLDQWVEASTACAGGTCLTVPATPLKAGTNSWWLRVWGPEGYGAWVGPQNFALTATPLPQITKVAPAAGTNLTTSAVNFTWNHNANAHSYEVYLAGPNGWFDYHAWDANTYCSGGTCAITINVPANGSYTWYLAGVNAAGTGDWGPPPNYGAVNFTVNAPLPGQITKLAPVSTALNSGLVNFSWQDDPAASAYALYVAGPGGWFDYRLWDDATYCGAGTCTITILLPANGAYTWYLRGKSPVGFGQWGPNDAGGNYGAANFTVNASPVGQVTKLTPLQGSNLTSNAVQLTWQETANATSYEIYLGGPVGWFSYLEYVPGTNAACSSGACTTTIYVPYNGTYNWYMRARSAAGFGTWGPVPDYGLRSFTVTAPLPPASPALLLPTNGATLTGSATTVNFQWQATADTTWYRLVLENRLTGTISELWYAAQNLGCEAAGSTCSVTPTVANGSYRWAVQTWGPASMTVPVYVPGVTPAYTFDKLGL